MTKRDDIDTVIRANEELLTVLAKVKEGFSSISLAQSEAAKTSNELGAQLADTGGIATANAEKSQTAAEKSVGAFETLNNVYTKYKENLTAVAFEQKLQEASLKSLESVHSSVYSAMEGQIMSFIETGRFSVGALMQIVAKQVKVELVGLAAKSAVWAIFEVAMGLATMWKNPAEAATHFASAKQFAIVGGAALAAA